MKMTWKDRVLFALDAQHLQWFWLAVMAVSLWFDNVPLLVFASAVYVCEQVELTHRKPVHICEYDD